MKDCIFCKICKKELDSKILFEDDLVIAIMDINPCVDGHSLVIPKNHHENIFETPNEILERVNVVSKKIAHLLKDKLECTGFNILNASGKDAQQSIFHLHYHLIPRYKNDGMDLWFHGNNTKNNIEKIYQKLK